MFRHSSITTKIAVPIILIVFLVLGGMTYFMVHHAWENAKQAAYDKTHAMGLAAANDMKADIEKSLVIARTLAQSLESLKTQNFTSRDLVIRLTKDLLRTNPHLIGTWTGWEPNAWDGKDKDFINALHHDASGRFIPYSSVDGGVIALGPLLEYDIPGPGDYYLVPKDRLKETMIDPYLYKIGDEMVMMTSAVAPIIHAGKFLGVAGVDLALKKIQGKVNGIRPFSTSVPFLVSSSGNYVSHPDTEMITKKSPFYDDQKFRETLTTGGDFSVLLKEADGEEYLYIATPFTLGETGQFWSLLIKTPMSTIVADAKSILWNQIGISLLGLLLLLGAIIFITKHITASMNVIIRGLQHESEVVTTNSHAVAQAAERISEANTEQAGSLQETVASVEEISAMVGRNADSAKNSVEKADLSTLASKKGKEKVRQMIDSIREIEKGNEEIIQQMQSSNKEISDIVGVIQDISTKTQVINDIVFQTKLLSFNASVEAARAGEQGKGFAVVAEEVGNLASMSGKAANEISDLLTRSVEQVTGTVARTKQIMETMIRESKSKVETGISTSHECDEVLNEILANVSVVNDSIKDISSASQEQSAGIAEINKAMNELDQTTQSSLRVANESAHTASELKAQARRLHDLIRDLNKLATGKDSTSDSDSSSGASELHPSVVDLDEVRSKSA